MTHLLQKLFWKVLLKFNFTDKNFKSEEILENKVRYQSEMRGATFPGSHGNHLILLSTHRR